MDAIPETTSRAVPNRARITFAAMFLASSSGHVVAAPAHPPATAPVLSVMSYNVKGLPWPIARGRDKALAAIGRRLASMRVAGIQPHVILLQEAFTGEAREIGTAAGYRYAIGGPATGQTNAAKASDALAHFARHASWLKGETEGKWLDSGLRILSDYPIVAARRLAFPSYACAGFDCLANKGALIAWIAVPGSPRPIAFVDTHLNSRGASGVANARADFAYALQLQSLRRFIASALHASTPAILAGDFNTGKAEDRLGQMRESPLPGATNSLKTAFVTPAAIPARSLRDAWAILKRGKDWLFFRPGKQTDLKLADFTVPFGTERDGSSLSDHMGYVVSYNWPAVTEPASERERQPDAQGVRLQP